ncbi:TIGR00730 family Rossman fold protein [Isoalcanivorax beigongshangi]|uniref:Cytokinin riboside 5'-monophosphate phosphoribohydrolase n=1 Tax=Isoalcanivorax beigongshangi TaxID=3238810 RepID=A0ABV4AGI1_9GAMM
MHIAVFCGSNPGHQPIYRDAAVQLGTAIAERGHSLVYGGASEGLMGTVADAALAAGGEVIGVLPQGLQKKEMAHLGLTVLHLVDSMHERKAAMAARADAFIALPGGAGTLEEMFEVWTWAQIGDHSKPCALFNVAGFYDGLLSFLDHVSAEGFMKPAHRQTLLVDTEVSALLDRCEQYQAPVINKWYGHQPG